MRAALALAVGLAGCPRPTDGGTVDTDTCEVVTCPGGGVLAAEVSEATLPTCADVARRYADVVAAGSPCGCDRDCELLIGQCGVGLGGCYEPGGACASQALLEEIGALWASHSEGCEAGVCDCAEPPAIACVVDRCVLQAPRVAP